MRRASFLHRALVLAACSCALACHKAAREPILPGDVHGLDREVVELIEEKVAAVRAAPSDARAHATLGLVYEANELWQESAQSFANAIELDDGQPVWLYHRALVLREAGRSEESIGLLREAARRMERDAAVQQRLGQSLLQFGDVPGARTAFDRALEAAPNQAECLAGMAGVELASERFARALELAQRALAIDPTFKSAAYTAGLALQGLDREAEARAFLAAGLGARPRWLKDPLTQELVSYRRTTSVMLEDASNAHASGNFPLAVRLYETLLKRKPDDAEIQNNLASNLIELGQLERAEKALALAEKRDPQAFAVQLNLAEMWLRRSDLARARAHADRAVELGGSVGRTHFLRARVMMQQNDLEGAARELYRTVELDASNPQYFLVLAEVAFKRNRGEETRMWCRKVLEISPNEVSARVNLGVLAMKAGDWEEARAMLAELKRQVPSDPRTIALETDIRNSGH
jgi:tetratricopeptide (TPR) repeat protein